MPQTRRQLCMGLVACGLTACGFRPRQPTAYAFQVIYIPPTPSPLLTELRRALAAHGGIEVEQDPRRWERADLSFDLLQELRDKVVIEIGRAHV